MPDIYLDVCCLNRPFDDQGQARIRLEAEAVLLILARLTANEWTWIGSEAMTFEVAQTPDPDRRQRVEILMRAIHRMVLIEGSETERAQELQNLGLHSLDALHLACAESGGADVFLTTDDRLLRVAARLTNEIRVRVANPLTWLSEVAP